MRHRHPAGLAVALVLALAAFTGSALAGGGNGSGGGNGNGHAQQAAPTQSAPSAQHGNSGSKRSDTSASNPATGGSNTHGVKPSSSTKHDTYAKASSDKTKQYGNGKTAGQIATQAGQPDATLHGPGNSQPHKTAACPGGHEVDVHALKNKGSKCGSAAPTKHEAKPEHVSKPNEHSVKTETPSSSSVAGQHVTICHATGSSSNPFVMISPDVSGVFHGHMGHQDARDIIPTFTYNGQSLSQNWDAAGQAIFNAGCKSSAPAAAQVLGTQHTESTASDCGTTTKTVDEQVLVGVWHKTGNGKSVLIHPSTHSAHYTGKHPDDKPAYETVQKTIVVKNADCPAVAQTQTVTTQVLTTQSAVAAVTATATPAAQTATPTAAPATAASAPIAAGSVKGATATLTPKAAAKKKPAGGVLGTTTRLGGTVASTRLPFTGLPLWIFVAIAAALILAGATVRRSGANRV